MHTHFRDLCFPMGPLSTLQHCQTMFCSSTCKQHFDHPIFKMTKTLDGLFRPVSPADGDFHVESSTELHVLDELAVMSSSSTLLSSGKQTTRAAVSTKGSEEGPE